MPPAYPPAAPFVPSPEEVVKAWAVALLGWDAARMSTRLPADEVVEGPLGFTTLLSYGGSPERNQGIQAPVVRLDFWAKTAGSAKPPWGTAYNLAGLIPTNDQPSHVARLETGLRTYPVNLLAAFAITQARKIENDPAGYAHVTLDLQTSWAIIR